MNLMAFNLQTIFLFLLLVLAGCLTPQIKQHEPAGKIIADYRLLKMDHWVSDSGLVFTA